MSRVILCIEDCLCGWRLAEHCKARNFINIDAGGKKKTYVYEGLRWQCGTAFIRWGAMWGFGTTWAIQSRDCTAAMHNLVHAFPRITHSRNSNRLIHKGCIHSFLLFQGSLSPIRLIAAQTQSAMTNPDCISIREQLSQYPGSKLGFVVYRLTYADDTRWAQFMTYLNTRIRLGLEKTGDGDLFQHIDWDVQEDPTLEEAEESEVRRYGFLPFSLLSSGVLLFSSK
jgi:hypothetical protein